MTDLLRRPGVRLLTLTGPGGVGKTRLALAVLAQVRAASTDDVVFVSLGAVSDSGLVAPAIARDLGVRQATDRPLAEMLAAALGDRRRVLALDNFEQVLPAAPLLVRLLADCPDLTVLVTSRAALRLYGEREFAVPPLGTGEQAVGGWGPANGGEGATSSPTPHSQLAAPAVELFVERAQAVRADFALTVANAATVAEICRQVDGLPLAVELAAARTRLLSPAALLMRLTNRLALLTGGGQDQPPRLQTMRAAIAWSHDLLTPEDQTAFRRLAVFAGGFGLDAAARMLDVGRWMLEEDAFADAPSIQHPASSILDALESLVAQSLLRREETPGGEPRFAFLETIREFAEERLVAAGEERAVRRRHVAWFLDLAEGTDAELRTAVRPALLDRLERDLPNLRAALDFLEGEAEEGAAGGAGSGATGDGLRLAAALGDFWFLSGRPAEGMERLERALAGAPVTSSQRARALAWCGALAHLAGDDERAVAALEEGLATAEETADRWVGAFALYELGAIAEDRGEYEAAAELFRRASARFRAPEDATWVVAALFHEGVVAFGLGDGARATARLGEALGRAQALDDRWSVCRVVIYLGIVALEAGDEAAAAAALAKGGELLGEVGVPETSAVWTAAVGALAAQRGQFLAAARLLAGAEARWRDLGEEAKLPERAVFAAAAERTLTTLGPDADRAARAEGRAMPAERVSVEAAEVLAAPAATGARVVAPVLSSPLGSSEPATHVPPAVPLTPREREVLRLVARGDSDRQIGEELGISRLTAATHVRNLLAKLGLSSRSAAAAYAVRHGLA